MFNDMRPRGAPIVREGVAALAQLTAVKPVTMTSYLLGTGAMDDGGRVKTSIMWRVTFSIVAFDPATRELGIAVQSKFLAVGAVVPWAKAGVGAIAFHRGAVVRQPDDESFANTAFIPEGLRLLADGIEPQTTALRLTVDDPDREKRQFGIVDAKGRAATYTGKACGEWAGGAAGDHYCVQGNILAGPKVVEGMAEAFERAKGSLPDRLVAALHGGQRHGGDRRGMQSAALLVVKEKGGYGGFDDRYIDLHVDDHARPIDELQRLLTLYKLYFKIEPPKLRAIDAALARELQEILARSERYRGPVSGQYNEATRDGLRGLFGIENLEERWVDSAEIDEAALAFLRGRFPA